MLFKGRAHRKLVRYREHNFPNYIQMDRLADRCGETETQRAFLNYLSHAFRRIGTSLPVKAEGRKNEVFV